MEAYGDESIRVICSPPVYLLAASYGSHGGDFDMGVLEKMKPKGARKLHWRDMGERARIRAIDSLATMDTTHAIVLGCNMAKNKQERARRKCLEVMLLRLESIGITRYILESRGKQQDKADIALLLSLRDKGICDKIEVVHEQGSDNSHLWIPDQILGAYGDVRCGTARTELGKAWNRLSPSVSTVEVWL